MDNTAAVGAPSAEDMDVEAPTGLAGEDGNEGNGNGRGAEGREGGKKRKAEGGGTSGIENTQAEGGEVLKGAALVAAIEEAQELYDAMNVDMYVSVMCVV